MMKMPDKIMYTEKICTVLLWVLAIAYFYFISIHSATPAEDSTKVSGTIAKKAYSIVQDAAAIASGEKNTKILYGDVFVFVRKSAHLLNFYIVGFLYSMTAFRTKSIKPSNAFMAAIICGLLGAIIDEGHQLFVPGRSAQLKDVFIDFTGILLGCITFFTGIIAVKVKMCGRNK